MVYASSSTAPTVLVTDADGFVGSATVLELVRRGYNVKAAVRSVSRALAFIKKHSEYAPSIEWAIVPSPTSTSAIHNAVADVDYIIHVATPFYVAYVDALDDVLLPVVGGTRAILEAASRQSRVKQVVLTSSLAAVLDPKKGWFPGKVYTPEDWNPVTWESALATSDPVDVYCASKTLAERTAWEFMASVEPQFSLTTFCPPMIFGPPLQPLDDLAQLNHSTAQQWAIFSGAVVDMPRTRFPVFVDVRDVAKLEVDALSNLNARGQRYLAVAGEYSNEQTAHIVHSAFPSQSRRVPAGTNARPAPHYWADTSKTLRDFGMEWIPLDKSVKDMAGEMYKIEREIEGEKARDGERVWWAQQEKIETPNMAEARVIEVV